MTGEGGVRHIVAAHLPGYRIVSVVRLGEGLDNVAYEVNGELIVRFRRDGEAAPVEREARLLAAVAGVSPLPVPEPVFTDPEQGCLAYFKLPGVPLLHLSGDHPSIAATLGGFLAALHAVPAERWAGLVDTDDPPPAEWLRDAAETYPAIAGQIPEVHRRAVRAFLDGPPPPGGHVPTFSHNDLGIEHVLVDPAAWTVTGIIDWSDAAIVDPAYDFGLIHRDLGPAALDAALRRYPGDVAAIRERAVFYARCSVFEDWAYGVRTGREEYVVKSRSATEWLFSADRQ